MPYYGEACKGCGGEDCVCCEVYLEEQHSRSYYESMRDEDSWDEYEDEVWESMRDWDEYEDDMDSWDDYEEEEN